MFFLLNGVMIYSVLKTRFAIKSMPNLFPNENLVLVHVLFFTVVTVLWFVYRVYATRNRKAFEAWRDEPTDDNDFAWTEASLNLFIPHLAYNTPNNLLSLFMLDMLHQFSIFEGFVCDPVSVKKIPVLSMFMTAKTMEKGMTERILTDRQHLQIKQLLDYEEAQEMFAASETSASIHGSFIAADVGESMRTLRQLDELGTVVCSDSDSAENEDDLEGEALQFALKGDPIPGSLGDDKY